MSLGCEGVIKFSATHQEAEIAAAEIAAVQTELLGWRALLHALGLIGQDATRYGGAGFGNVSARLPPFAAGRHQRAFVITGTQTCAKPTLCRNDLCVVSGYDYDRNQVLSRGPVLPSSEAMTHAAVYDSWTKARFVFHVHSPTLWHAAGRLGLPTTAPDVAYGTPEIARAVRDLVSAGIVRKRGVFVMGGHQDGVVAFATSAPAAGAGLLHALALALAPAIDDI